MNEAIAFDTHRYIKRLTRSGFSEQQAETLADELVTVLNSNLATKADIAQLGAELERLRLATQADIEKLSQETKAEIAKLGAELERLRLATQADIEKLSQETKVEMAKIEASIERIKSELLKWFVGALIAQGGLVVALTALL